MVPGFAFTPTPPALHGSRMVDSVEASWEHVGVTQAPVVVGIDLSTSGLEAVRQAAAWAARPGAPLVVAHVAPDELSRALETPKVADALRERVATTLGDAAP